VQAYHAEFTYGFFTPSIEGWSIVGLGLLISCLTTIASLLRKPFAFTNALLALLLVILITLSHRRMIAAGLLTLLVFMELIVFIVLALRPPLRKNH